MASPRPRLVYSRTGIEPANDDTDTAVTMSIDGLFHLSVGRKLIYVNQPFTQSIVGMTRAESDALLEFLYGHNASPQFQCRFRWRTNSIAMWDNRCTQHHATWDYYPETRSGVRVTVKGDRPRH